MPISKTSIERNNFTGGLITEATALTFPENTAIEIDNFDINRNGSLRRRLGLDIETNGQVVDTGKTPLTFANHSITSYKWENAGNNPSRTIGIVQVGNELWFVDLFTSVLSNNILNGGAPVKLNDTLDVNISGNAPLDYAAIQGQCIISSSELDSPIVLGYSEEDDEIGVTPIKILVRDLWGLDDLLPTDERPAELDVEHDYNLRNQGWRAVSRSYDATTPSTTYITLAQKFPGFFKGNGNLKSEPELGIPVRGGGAAASSKRSQRRKIIKKYGSNAKGSDPIPVTTTTGYPSNADIPWVGKKSDGSFDTDLIEGAFYGTSPAPRGRFILDAFNRGGDRARLTELEGLNIDADSGNPSVVAAYANRVFYSGVDSVIEDPDERSPDYTGTIFFSQSIDNTVQLGRCYQEADPTSEDDPLLVATDGGVIKIAEASRIVKLVALEDSLVVVAENGVWAITGPDGVFKADEYAITQLTNVGCNNGDSVVVADNVLMYWGDSGIYALTSDQISGRLRPQNLTESTIQTFYNAIPNVSKLYCKAHFDEDNRKVSWLYSDSASYDGITLRHNYNRELILDTVLGSFYTRTIPVPTDGSFVAGYLAAENFINISNTQQVVVDGESVVVNGEEVVVTEQVRGLSATTLSYVSFKPNFSATNYGIFFSNYGNVEYKDWNEVDAAAHLVTGYELGGDTQRSKQVLYFTAHFNQSETGFELESGEIGLINPSSCLVQARWDFSDSTTSGKWGTPFQAYRLRRNYIPLDVSDPFDYGYSVITTKTKMRGTGRALSIRFDTEPEKDCHMLGWGMIITGEQDV